MKAAPWWNEARTPIAFLVAPLAVPLIWTLYLRWPLDDLATGLLIVFSALVAYIGTFLFGLPLYLFLRARNATTFPIAAAFGFVVGALTVVLILGRDMSSDTFGLAGLSGAAVGAILWLIDQPGRQPQ